MRVTAWQARRPTKPRRVRLLGAGLGVLLKVGGRMSVVMLWPSLALSTVTGLNVYVSILLMGVVTTIYAMEGGFEAVVWTDVMQVSVTYGGVAVALFFLAQGVDGGRASSQRGQAVRRSVQAESARLIAAISSAYSASVSSFLLAGIISNVVPQLAPPSYFGTRCMCRCGNLSE